MTDWLNPYGIAMSMPWVFVAFFGIVAVKYEKSRLTASIIFLSAAINIVLADFYVYVSELAQPVLTTFAFYAFIDFLTITVLYFCRPFKVAGHIFGKHGSARQAEVLMYFIGFNVIVWGDYQFHKRVLDTTDYYFKDVFIYGILLLNLLQLNRMGGDIGLSQGNRIRRGFVRLRNVRLNRIFGYTSRRLQDGEETIRRRKEVL